MNDKPERYPHGTAARYNHGPAGDGVDPCRDDCCRVPAMAAQRARRAAKKAALIDAAPTRAHLAALRAAGLSVMRIARRAGLHYRTVATVLYGNPADGRPPSNRIHPATAHKLLAVVVPPRSVAWLRPADRSVGRLRALVSRGWSISVLAQRLELDHSHLHKLVRGDKTTVTAATELAVITLHRELWSQEPPHETRHQRGAATRARREAAANGWALPVREVAS